MNLSYDLTMVDAMLRARTGAGLADDVPLGPVVDCMVLDKQADRFRRGGRKLGDLCREYGVEHAGEHDAAADVEASVRVTLSLLARHPELAGMGLDDLVRAQVVVEAPADREPERVLRRPGRNGHPRVAAPVAGGTSRRRAVLGGFGADGAGCPGGCHRQQKRFRPGAQVAGTAAHGLEQLSP